MSKLAMNSCTCHGGHCQVGAEQQPLKPSRRPSRTGQPPGDGAVGEPVGNLLLGVLDGVGAVADVAADIQGEVATDGAGGRGQGVGGTEESWSGQRMSK